VGYREVGVMEVRELLRLWGMRKSHREIGRLMGCDRKTVGRYVRAAEDAGLRRVMGAERSAEETIARTIELVQRRGSEFRGSTWKTLEAHREELAGWVEQGLRLTKVQELLRRKTGRCVPYRTLHRYATEELGFGKRRVTVRVEDAAPGEELQVDFGRMGTLPIDGTPRVVWALIFTACYSRHQFVWLTVRQAMAEVIEGFERAWEFFGGIFRVVIPDNLKAIVAKADALSPQLSEGFLEYAQERGFVVDPARVRRPDDKPRVERQVGYVRASFFAGESFRDLDEARRRAETWCLTIAGMRRHGTTQKRPLEVFEGEEKGRLLAAPVSRYAVPLHADVTVGLDHHVRADRALYSVPTAWVGQKVHVRADAELVRISSRGQLIKTHPRQQPGGRSTDPDDYPPEKAIYATRDRGALLEKARAHGPSCGGFAEKLLEGPLPWSRMRHVYRLLSLVRTYGPERVDSACRQALEHDAIDVMRIARMLERALETTEPPRTSGVLGARLLPFRFQRSAEEFMLRRNDDGSDDER
jgi:transposase